MRRLNNINEEINRMKSLFTEERMFGNLVENEEVINESNLKVGSKGEGVEALQTLLGIEPVDGVFGPKTKEAVIKMQKEAGLNADGIVGPKTLEGLKKKLSLNEDESDNLEDGNKDLLNIVSKEVTGKPIVKVSAGPGKEGFNADSDGDGVPDYLQKDNPQNKKGETEPVKGPEGKTSSTKVTKGEDGTKTTKSGAQQKRGGQGTDAKGDSMSDDDFKKSKKGTTSERGGVEIFGMKLDRVDIINNKASCREHIRKMMVLSKNGKTRKEIEGETEKDGKEYIKKIEWCLSNFYNVFEKNGVFKRGSRVMTMLDTWNIPVPEKVSGGLEGEKYTVKLEDGQKIAVIKKVKQNKYRFRSALNVPLIDKGSGRPMFNQDNYEQAFYDTLNIDKNKKKIVIQRAFEKKKIDMGTFVIADR